MINRITKTKLRALVANDPSLLEGPTGSGDVKEASVALARIAESHGIKVEPEELEQMFGARPGGDVEELDDAALEHVAGGGSPYCMCTKGCYCFGTK